ncbi:electron transfer flavoprotein subunit alpha/FixB family protein [Hydrotalea sp.]|uniref:electron transfer flavoprotein subunit alpha/FixB family protein n=1 Tax=Hydrotalea sp. TaxID=2881279 RepID=UPI0026133E66|nr:electron transfer flavoprotein subunit alpha/FixB family protein [Hydrotalea sp.]
MSVLIFIDQSEGHLKKASFEAAAYGAAVAKQMNTNALALVLGNVADGLTQLGNYGISKVYQIQKDIFNHVDAQVFATVITNVVKQVDASIVIFSHTQTGKAVAPGVAVQLKAGLVTGACALPQNDNGFVVKKTVFSGKAFALVNITSPIKVITLNPNSFGIQMITENATVEALEVTVPNATIQVVATNKVSGEVPLSEADIVVSGGRGLKGPENWGMIEDLAHVLHAATACSRPVADAHWRPHHEHVGQTGVQIAPNLYIAIGISGAIQHLAGVNRSKTIVVINKDPEAPFFKAADYGIVGDAFEVVPKLTAAIKEMQSK